MKSFQFIAIFFLLFSVVSCSGQSNVETISKDSSPLKKDKITGVSLEMPGHEMGDTVFQDIKPVGAKWLSMIPYAATLAGESEVQYWENGQWWGETLKGTKVLSEYARKDGYKIMWKPHVWVVGAGWPGKFDPGSEENWLKWETSYEKYILAHAERAEEQKAEIFCIGTEYRIAVVERKEFWKNLIKKVREIYSGTLTYAANWDNYHRVEFWDQLDVIGIDGYFPHSKAKEPSLDELRAGWNEVCDSLSEFSKKYDKQILFTEYGFKSADFTSSGSGDKDKNAPNMQNQVRAYQAFFETIWQKDWFAGGFLWKWHLMEGKKAGGENNSRYTIQNKPAFDVVRKYYNSKMKIDLPKSKNTLVVRTDYSDDLEWNKLKLQLAEPSEDGFIAYLDYLESEEFEDIDFIEKIERTTEEYDHPILFVVDSTTMNQPERPILCLEWNDENPRYFRVIPSEMWQVENNLSIANMDFEDFLNNCDEDGIFRGF